MRRIYLYQLGPCGYALSRKKEILLRNWQDRLHRVRFAETYSEALLPIVINRHNSLIRRKLGNVDLQLQENKAVNLALAAPRLTHLLIRPKETFSFWQCVGECTAKKGYKEGLTLSGNRPSHGIGGGMCQMTNLIHWMVLHSALTITEHHHHGRFDLFPDFGRQVPFGTGTSIVYNYLDYRVENRTSDTYQLVITTTDRYLRGELRCDRPQPLKFHIYEQISGFSWEEDGAYRHNVVRLKAIDKKSGKVVFDRVLIVNHAKVMYDPKWIDPSSFRESSFWYQNPDASIPLDPQDIAN